jgi:hypothetical protein
MPTYFSCKASLKRKDLDGLTQPATTNFRLGNIGRISASRSEVKKLIMREKKAGNH